MPECWLIFVCEQKQDNFSAFDVGSHADYWQTLQRSGNQVLFYLACQLQELTVVYIDKGCSEYFFEFIAKAIKQFQG